MPNNGMRRTALRADDERYLSRHLRGSYPSSRSMLSHRPPSPEIPLLQRIAAEARLTNTFLVGGDGRYKLRWSTPTTEMWGICGHSTLPAEFVAAAELHDNSPMVEFHIQDGCLRILRYGLYNLIFELPALVPDLLSESEEMRLAFQGIDAECGGGCS